MAACGRSDHLRVNARWESGSCRSRGAPVAAELQDASVLQSGGEGRRKSHPGASSSQIMVEGRWVGWRETRVDT